MSPHLTPVYSMYNVYFHFQSKWRQFQNCPEVHQNMKIGNLSISQIVRHGEYLNY